MFYSLLEQYNYSIISTENDFVLSDAFISVASLEYETFYVDYSNCNIGIPKTIILIPLTNKFYLIFYNTNDCNISFRKKFKKLTEKETFQINSVIYRNSFLYCISSNEDILKKLKENIFHISKYNIYTKNMN